LKKAYIGRRKTGRKRKTHSLLHGAFENELRGISSQTGTKERHKPQTGVDIYSEE
jgi:hypothetical protein